MDVKNATNMQLYEMLRDLMGESIGKGTWAKGLREVQTEVRDRLFRLDTVEKKAMFWQNAYHNGIKASTGKE